MNLSGKKVLVVGLARSGMAAIRVLKKLGAVITLSESKKKEDIKEIDFLNENGVEIVGQDAEVFERDFDLVVKNPGVPFRSPAMQRLAERNIPVITEIELAYQVAKPQHYIAVTGTNGKTTTTTLVYEILKRAFPGKAHLCGNIGIPLCEIVMENGLMEEGGHYIALEISNFQLVNIDKFRPEVAVIINLTPDHIDVMGGLDAYYKSKTEVYRNMADSDVFLLNADDPVVKEYTDRYIVVLRPAVGGTDVGEFNDSIFRCDYGGTEGAATLTGLDRSKIILVACGSGPTSDNTGGALRVAGAAAASARGGRGGTKGESPGSTKTGGINAYDAAQVAAGKSALFQENVPESIQNPKNWKPLVIAAAVVVVAAAVLMCSS